jgi:hypothetical protein
MSSRLSAGKTFFGVALDNNSLAELSPLAAEYWEELLCSSSDLAHPILSTFIWSSSSSSVFLRISFISTIWPPSKLLVVSRLVVENDETGLRNVSVVAVFFDDLKATTGSVLSKTKHEIYSNNSKHLFQTLMQVSDTDFQYQKQQEYEATVASNWNPWQCSAGKQTEH